MWVTISAFPHTAKEEIMSDSLEKNWKDRVALLSSGTLSFIPVVGGALGAAIYEIIPGLHQERIVEYIKNLETRLDELGEEIQQKVLTNQDRLDIIEQGGLIAARSLSSERIQHVVHAVFNGITADQSSVLRYKRILSFLDELDDEQILLLTAYQSYGSDRENHCWGSVNRPRTVERRDGVLTQSGDDFELYKLGRDQLVRLQLLEEIPTQNATRRFEKRNPEMNVDDALQISYLGKLLLREIGL